MPPDRPLLNVSGRAIRGCPATYIPGAGHRALAAPSSARKRHMARTSMTLKDNPVQLARLRNAAKVYATTRSYAEAARAVGVAPATVSAWARAYPQWSRWVAEEAQLAERIVGVTMERVLAELAAVAFADIRDVIEWDEHGNVKIKPSAELTPEQARAIGQVELDGHGRLRVRMTDKLGALRALSDALGLTADRDDAMLELLREVARRRRERLGLSGEPLAASPPPLVEGTAAASSEETELD